MLWGWIGGIAPEKKQQEGVYTATIEWSPDSLFSRVDAIEERLKRIEEVANTKAVRVPFMSPAEFDRRFPPSDYAQRKAIQDAVRWHYCSLLCGERHALPSGVLTALEASVPDDVEQLKAEAAQWAKLVRDGLAPETWEEAMETLGPKPGVFMCSNCGVVPLVGRPYGRLCMECANEQ